MIVLSWWIFSISFIQVFCYKSSKVLLLLSTNQTSLKSSYSRTIRALKFYFIRNILVSNSNDGIKLRTSLLVRSKQRFASSLNMYKLNMIIIPIVVSLLTSDLFISVFYASVQYLRKSECTNRSCLNIGNHHHFNTVPEVHMQRLA